MRKFQTCLVAVALVAAACKTDRFADETSWIPSTPYDKYVHSIQEAGLGGSAVVRDWVDAGERAMDRALPIFAPYSQVGFFDPTETRAQGYRIEAKRGQKLLVEFEVSGPDSLRLFVDLFRAPRSPGVPPVHVASADTLSGTLEFVAYWDGAYLLRLQPELLRGGRYHLTVRNSASLDFPVVAHDTRAIKSVWGDARDGGARSHQGVDIFAPRWTPVVATTSGTVSFVGTNRLGGNVVWLRDSQRGYSYYYAHLEEQSAQRGQRVESGDTLGFVGNSGNAITTPTHLHFGVYVRGRGAVNPYWYLYSSPADPRPVAVDSDQLGGWARINVNSVSVRESPSSSAPALSSLERNTPLRLLSGTGNWFEVVLPDQTSGFVPGASLTSLERPLDTRLVASGGLLVNTPSVDGVPTDSLEPGTTVNVLGNYADFSMVESERGRLGWMRSGDMASRVALGRPEQDRVE